MRETLKVEIIVLLFWSYQADSRMGTVISRRNIKQQILNQKRLAAAGHPSNQSMRFKRFAWCQLEYLAIRYQHLKHKVLV